MFKKYAAAWAIFVVVCNVIIFAIPSEIAGMIKTGGAFWSSYIMIMLAFIGQLVCAKIAFKESEAERFFLKLPLVTISYIALILSIAAGTVCMLIPCLLYTSSACRFPEHAVIPGGRYNSSRQHNYSRRTR